MNEIVNILRELEFQKEDAEYWFTQYRKVLAENARLVKELSALKGATATIQPLDIFQKKEGDMVIAADGRILNRLDAIAEREMI
jgi:hypothetical protein